MFVERKVNDDEGKVAELKRKLADAESDLKKSK